MTKKLIRIMIAVMSMVFVLVGCESNKGGYLEHDVTLINDNQIVCMQSNLEEENADIFLLNSTQSLYCYNVAFDKYDLNQKTMEGLKAFNKIIKDKVEQVFVDEDQNIYITYIKRGEWKLAKINEAHEVEDIPLNLEEDIEVSKLEVSEGGHIFLQDDEGNIYEYEQTSGNLVRDYKGQYLDFTIKDNNLYIISADKKAVEVYDLDSGELLNDIGIEKFDTNAILKSGQEENEIYLSSLNGVFKLSDNHKKWEEVINPVGTTFNNLFFITKDITRVGDKFVVLFESLGGAQSLKVYEYSAELEPTELQEVRVYTLEDNNSIRIAVSEYQQEHPEVYINFEVGISEESTLTKEDAVKTLNTELLVGSGPDLIVLDGLDIETYMEKGVLTNLNDLLDSTSLAGLKQNMINAYQQDENLYALPTRFSLPLIWGESKVLDNVHNLDELISYIKQYPDEKVISDRLASSWIDEFYPEVSDSLITEEGKIDTEEMIHFLSNIQVLKQDEASEVIELTGEGSLFFEADVIMDMSEIAYKGLDICFSTPVSLHGLLLGGSVNEMNTDSTFDLFSANGEEMYEPKVILGVTEASEHKEIAKEIIEVAISDAFQQEDLGEGFPMNENALEKWTSGTSLDEKNDLTNVFMIPGREMRYTWGYEEVIEKFKEISEHVNKPMTTDEVLLEIVKAESKPYFEGEISVEEAVEQIEEKTYIYLAE